MRTSSRPAAAALALAAALGLGGCGSAVPGSAEGGGGGAQRLTVFAAASVADALEEIAADLRLEHPEAEITVLAGGSSGLAQQILQGAPADVFASADSETMRTAVDGGAVDGAPVDFASNTLQIAVPPGNPAGVDSLADLGDPALAVAACAEEVPCGALSLEILAAAGVALSADTLEQDVRAVLTRVELGEVDAGLVYRTDVLAAAGRVEGVDAEGAEEAATRYPIARLVEARSPELAEAFLERVLSERGREVLDAAGFGGV